MVMDILEYIKSNKIDKLNKYKFFKYVIDNSYDEIYVTDGLGIILYTNIVCEKKYDMQIQDLVGASIYELEKKRIFYPTAVKLVLEEKRTITMIQETQTGIKAEVIGNPVFNKNKEIVMVVCSSRDITSGNTQEQLLQESGQFLNRYSKTVKELEDKKRLVNFVSQSKQMEEVIVKCEMVAGVDTTIFLLGESGVGKDIIAKEIHMMSDRRSKPFVSINCGAIPATLFESELFGYEGGSFTNAKKEGKIGLIESANKGTLFLNEVTEIPLEFQSKLLQVIQDKNLKKIGGVKPITLDIRIIAATNRNINKMVEEGLFREDLFYRLYVVPIEIIPLRMRKDDIFPLTQLFLNKFNRKYGREKYISNEAMNCFLDYEWPGNVRELENFIERIVVTSLDQLIGIQQLPQNMTKSIYSNYTNIYFDAVEDVKEKLIYETYKTLGSSYKVAEKLGISQRTAARMINKYVKKK